MTCHLYLMVSSVGPSGTCQYQKVVLFLGVLDGQAHFWVSAAGAEMNLGGTMCVGGGTAVSLAGGD